MRSRHCAAECRLDRWSSCIRSMSDLGQSAVLTVRRPLPAFPHKQTFSGSVGMPASENLHTIGHGRSESDVTGFVEQNIFDA
jgi:hypothetical protein